MPALMTPLWCTLRGCHRRAFWKRVVNGITHGYCADHAPEDVDLERAF